MASMKIGRCDSRARSPRQGPADSRKMFSERKVQSTLATPTTIPMINAAKQENIRRSLIIPTLPLYARMTL